MCYVLEIEHTHLLIKQLSNIFCVPDVALDTLGFEVNQVDGYSSTLQSY